ncbi:uncharacterized protein [Aristolochia californica]|uniref:uncharacterized protein n=1 Tax=Aristolochia californica TaxID=171875 RepID=UPI0035D6D988
MPGAIQVSVLGLMDLPSSLMSLVSVKVAIGKREFQTRDKGDFSFPLVNLRDILIVTLCDAEGKEISRIDIQTKSVVEKGLWDDMFPFKEGGLVHMKLLFNLNEEERKRIRDMRESILRKKQVELGKRSLTSSETPIDSNIGPKEANRADQSETTAPMEGQINLYKKFIEANGPSTGDMFKYQCPPALTSSQSAVDPQLECSRPSLSENTHKSRSLSLTSGGDGLYGSEIQSAKCSSNSVRKMISAFESTLPQGISPPSECLPKSEPTNSQAEVLATRASSEKAEIESKLHTRRKQSSTEAHGKNLQRPNWSRSTNMLKAETAQPSFLATVWETRKAESYVKEKVRTEGRRYHRLDERTAYETSDGTFTSKNNELLVRNSYNLPLSEDIQLKFVNEGAIRNIKDRHSEILTGSRAMEEAEVLGPGLVEFSGANELSSSCRVIEGREKAQVEDKHNQSLCASSTKERERQGLMEMKYTPLESLDGWLFYTDSRHLCITTAGKQVRNFIDGYHIKSETHHVVGELYEEERETAIDILTEVTKGCKAPHDLQQVDHEYSEDPTKGVGFYEQVLKITVILVCGTLFLSTAQRKAR